MRRRRVADVEAEADRLSQALHDILAECKREKTEQRDWPLTVGAVQAIARAALGYNVSRIEGPFRFVGLTEDGIPRLERVTP